jgi:hypothetical protein
MLCSFRVIVLQLCHRLNVQDREGEFANGLSVTTRLRIAVFHRQPAIVTTTFPNVSLDSSRR